LHLKESNLSNWDKVTKRYFTEASLLRIVQLRKYCYYLFIGYPSLRENILRYLRSFGFTQGFANLILRLLRDVKRYDDVTLFNFCKLLTDLEIPTNKAGSEFIKSVLSIILPPASTFDLYCVIWFFAKYGEPNKLMEIITKYKNFWKNEQFLTRQIVSVIPRILNFNDEIAYKFLNEQMSTGPGDAASVAADINSLLNTEMLGRNLSSYLFPPNPQTPYPLSKYLILLTVLSSKLLKPAQRKRITNITRERITDKWYLHWLNKYDLLLP